MNANEVFKELKKERTKLEYQIKKVTKLEKMYSSKFSEEQRLLAKTCQEGEVVKCLRDCINNYIDENLNVYHGTIENFIKNRPSHLTLLNYSPSQKNLFNFLYYGTTRRFYNKFFAKEWIKNNWENIVRSRG
jgi:hypothetical protein